MLHSALKRVKKLDEKIREYEAAARKNPKDEIPLRILARLYASQLYRRPARAIEKYELLRKLAPRDVEVREQLAQLYRDTSQRQEALAIYEELLELNPKRFRFYLIDASSMLMDGRDKDDALEWCGKVARAYPGEAAVPLRVANIQEERRRYAEAARAYKKAISLSKEYGEKLPLYARLVEAQMAARRYAEAETSCREALKLDIRSRAVREKFKRQLIEARRKQGKPAKE
jgi:tetratricopeptide (TPR) repeat protein